MEQMIIMLVVWNFVLTMVLLHRIIFGSEFKGENFKINVYLDIGNT